MSEWQPIHTYPGNQMEVLICVRKKVVIDSRDVWIELGANVRGRWINSLGEPFPMHSHIVTHWMPLPEPPKEMK